LAGSASAQKKTPFMVSSDVNQDQQPFPLDSEGTPYYKRRYRWVMLALVWICYLVFGLVAFALAPLVTPIIEDLNISYSQMGFILGAWPLTYVVVAAVGGAVVDRLGIRKSLFLGVTIIGLSALLRYLAGGFGTMFLCVALFGIGGPMISIGAPKTISLWFQGRERGTAVGFYMTGIWIGGAVTLSTVNSVIMPLAGYNWRLVFAGFGLLAFIVASLWLFLARDIKTGETRGGDRIDRVFRGLISLRSVQLILAMGFITFAISHGFNGWLPKILEFGGLSPAIAGLAASIPTWVSIPAILIIPRLVAPHLRGRIIAVLSLFVAAAILVIPETAGTSLITGLVFYGITHCSIMPLLVLILMDSPEVGSRYMGSAAGMYFCISEIGGFIGPLIAGAIKDLAGGFLLAACFLAGLAFLRTVIALFVKIRPAQ
jgi:CP family cyanate transporter-like MFS transporter